MNQAIFGLMLLLGLGLSGRAAQAQPACAERDSALDVVVIRLLHEVRNDDAEGFLKDTAQGKLRFGGIAFSHDDLTRDFAARSGVYCDLFSCNGKTGKWHDYFYGDVIQSSVSDQSGTTVAEILTGRYGDGEFSMLFARTPECAWQLTGIDATSE